MNNKSDPTITSDFEYLVISEVMRLGRSGYTVPIAESLSKKRGKRIQLGAVHTSLRRLEQKGFLTSRMGEPTEERGGKAKRLYAVTGAGHAAMRSRQTEARAIYSTPIPGGLTA